MSDVLIIGSGVGGATVARELAIRGIKVTILEKGKYHKVGTERWALGFYAGSSTYRKMLRNFSPGEKSSEGTEILRAVMVGGSSVVTFGNGVRALQSELETLGIHLEDEFKEAERELNVAPLPESLMGERTKILMKASKELGYDVKPMPKFINFSKCRNCGNCVAGCRYGAKWTAQKFVSEAVKAGAKLVTDTYADEVLYSSGEVKGVRVYGPSGSSIINADNIVLAAGGIETPIILQKSGLTNAGSNLFADLLVNTYGMIKKGDMTDEIGMATLIDEFYLKHGFILSPVLDTTLDMFLYLPIFKKSRAFKRRRILGLMTKIMDDEVGRVDDNGAIHKPVTENDWKKLKMGVEISKKILTHAGADPHSVYVTHVRAGHPGGTAGIGRVVNADNETEINRLFVSDASVLPKAPGLPPVLTIIAISKRFSKKLASEYF